MEGSPIEIAKGLLGKMPHLLPKEREAVLAGVEAGGPKAKKTLALLQGAYEEYATRGTVYERAVRALFERATAKLDGAMRGSSRRALARKESHDRSAENPDDLLAGL